MSFFDKCDLFGSVGTESVTWKTQLVKTVQTRVELEKYTRRKEADSNEALVKFTLEKCTSYNSARSKIVPVRSRPEIVKLENFCSDKSGKNITPSIVSSQLQAWSWMYSDSETRSDGSFVVCSFTNSSNSSTLIRCLRLTLWGIGERLTAFDRIGSSKHSIFLITQVKETRSPSILSHAPLESWTILFAWENASSFTSGGWGGYFKSLSEFQFHLGSTVSTSTPDLSRFPVPRPCWMASTTLKLSMVALLSLTLARLAYSFNLFTISWE